MMLCLGARSVHVSGLFARRERPPAMMVPVDRNLIKMPRLKRVESVGSFRSPA